LQTLRLPGIIIMIMDVGSRGEPGSAGGSGQFIAAASEDTAAQLRHQLTRTDLVRYAGASGDFNPMHHDEIKATAAGVPSVFGHGMFSAGVLAKALTDFVGVGTLTHYKVRFVKQTWPGETLVSNISVSSRSHDAGRTVLNLSCSLTNEVGEVKVEGEATARIPERSDGA